MYANLSERKTFIHANISQLATADVCGSRDERFLFVVRSFPARSPCSEKMAQNGTEWTNDKVLRLIGECEIRPVLWNPNDPYYKSKIKKQKAWEEIARVLHSNRFDVERKFKILLVQYRREKARISKLIGGDVDADELSRLEYSSWYAYKAFRFYLNRSKTKTKSGGSDSDVTYDSNATEYEEIKIEPGCTEDFANGVDAFSANRMEEGMTASNAKITNYDELPAPKDVKSIRSVAVPTIKYGVENVDETDLFVTYIASEIRNLRSWEVRKKLKRRILEALLEAGDEDDAIGGYPMQSVA